MIFQQLLENAREGGGILFCGSGFSTDCLNFNSIEEIGTGSTLLNLLNDKLRQKDHRSGFLKLEGAAAEYRNKEGAFGLMQLLVNQYKIANVTEDMVSIATFPWDRIYTTNYDNAIELSFTRANRPFRSLNNLERTGEVSGNGTEIVHLHGSSEKWNINNFENSCILWTESYFEAHQIDHWMHQLRTDLERAGFILFIGFSVHDFHINQVLYNASGLQSKIFFINGSGPVDPDTEQTQEIFGTPLGIDRGELAVLIRKTMAAEMHREPALHCYRRYSRPAQSLEVPSVNDIEDMFIFGNFKRTHFVRDINQKTSDYHILRTVTGEILNAVESSNASIALIIGEICDGKTIVVEEICAHLSLTRPVFILRHPYDDVLAETVKLLKAYRNAAVIIENFFNLIPERRIGLAKQFDASEAALILTSRNIAAEAESSDLSELEKLSTFRKFQLGKLDQNEVNALIALADQLAAWREFQNQTYQSRNRFIQGTCDGSLPGFLLRLLKSGYVKNKYIAEYEKLRILSQVDMRAIITALYVSNIGYDAPLSFLSNVFKYDVGAMVERLGRQDIGLRLVRRDKEHVKTVPGIGARNILSEIIGSRDVVNTVIEIVRVLSERDWNDDFSNHMFTQMMRYSILSSVVKDSKEIDRFFDNISKVESCRRRILFWLQWHMAKTDQEKFSDAEKYLEQGYARAQDYQRGTGRVYDTRQLDDRKAKFLMIRGRIEGHKFNHLFHDFREACTITTRLLRSSDITHHPYDTLREISEFLKVRGHELDQQQLETAHIMLKSAIELAKSRIGNLKSGFQVRRAQQALENLII